MIDNSAAVQELTETINDMGNYTMTATDFVNSVENMRRSAKVSGRGRGIARPLTQDGLEEVRLAAQINRLQPKAVPIGQLATTEETLARNFDAEITARIRAMGIYGADGSLNSNRTRRTVIDAQDIHVDGNFPVILNRDLFRPRYEQEAEGEMSSISPHTLEPYDPELPLSVQFSTIPEFKHRPTTPEPKDRAKRPHQKAKKGKKTKWRKITDEDLEVDNSRSPGRYDIDAPIGPGIPVNRFYRDVVGDDGTKYLQ